MDGDIVRRLSNLGGLTEGDAIEQIERILTTFTGSSLTVEGARDTFDRVLESVLGGDAQLIGRKTADMAVVISLKDIAALICASQEKSFGSALDEVGFQPLGRRIRVASRVDRPGLHRADATDGTTISRG